MPGVILFGAGASFGSGNSHPRRPPLGNQVAEDLARTFPTDWSRVPAPVQQALKENFELGAADLLNEGNHLANVILRMSGILFSQYTPGPGNAYRTLASRLAEAGLLTTTATATLNYDCMWELAVVEETGRPISYWNAAPNAVYVLKPHGSCNFRNPAMKAQGNIAWTPVGVSFEGPLEAFDPREVPDSILGNQIPPAMAFYETNKAVPVSRSAIERLQRNWAEVVESAARITVVGVRPNDHDNHIFKPLLGSDAPMQIVGTSQDLTAWTKLGFDESRLEAEGKGFSDSVERILSFQSTSQ